MSDGIKIGYLTGMYPRATDTFIRGEVDELRRIGFDVQPFCIRRTEEQFLINDEIRAEAERTIPLLSGNGVKLVMGGLKALVCSPRRLWRTWKLARKTGHRGIRGTVWLIAYVLEAVLLAGYMKRLGIRLIHNHIAGNSSVVAMLASEYSGIPFSQTVHGCYIFYEPKFWQLGETVKRSVFTICISHFCKSQCMFLSEREAWDRLKIVHCGVGSTFLDVPPRPMPEKVRLVCVGRLCPVKGQVLMMDAARRLVDEGLDFEIVFVGDGESREEIEDVIREHRLEDVVKITGWCESEEVRRHIEDSRALVLCSFAEGLPVVIMEALALGRPVLATRITGIVELVKEGENGWLVTPSSVDELTDAMREVIHTDVDRLEEMGMAGRERVIQDFNQAVEARKLGEVMRTALGEAVYVEGVPDDAVTRSNEEPDETGKGVAEGAAGVGKKCEEGREREIELVG